MQHTRDFKTVAFALIEWVILLALLGWEFILVASNCLGLAWWARIKTIKPNAIYWFGPFLSRNTLESNLEYFLLDITEEQPLSISHSILQCTGTEPYTLIDQPLQANIPNNKKPQNTEKINHIRNNSKFE